MERREKHLSRDLNRRNFADYVIYLSTRDPASERNKRKRKPAWVIPRRAHRIKSRRAGTDFCFFFFFPFFVRRRNYSPVLPEHLLFYHDVFSGVRCVTEDWNCTPVRTLLVFLIILEDETIWFGIGHTFVFLYDFSRLYVDECRLLSSLLE